MSVLNRLFVSFILSTALAVSAAAATYTVTKTADTNDGACDADCSLREAIAAANATADNDVIEFSSLFGAEQTITLGGTDLIIGNGGTLTINGPGADKLTVSGNNASRVFTNNTGAVTVINRLRVTGGTGASTVTTGRGGGVYNSGGNLTLNFVVITGNSTANGGGANNAGTATLTINNSIIAGNTATGSGGALQNFSGNTLNVYNSLIAGNTCNSTGTGGGGIQANGTVNVVNTTFSGNTAAGGSGGAIFFNGAAINLTNVTIAGNTSTNNGGGLNRSGTGALNIRNSIVAGNNGTAGSPDVTAALNSLGNNIIGNVGTSTGWIASDLQNVDPLLGALADNGGFSQTRLPLAGSPAINGGQNCVVDLSCAANNPSIAVTTDQRGTARPAGSAVDIGAVELVVAVNVGGTVVASNGAVRNAFVTLAGPGGAVATARTNSFGNFRLTGVAAGQTYTLTVAARGYTFAPQQVVVNAEVTGLVVTAAAASALER